MFKEAKKLVEKSKSIYVVGHLGPDGDSLGSAFAMYLALKKIGKDVKVLLTNYSEVFSFLPRINEAVKFVDKSSYDLLICVDSSDKDRLDISKEDFAKANKVLVLDHHERKAPYGDINCIDENLPAASEIVYNFLNYLKIKIDKEIGTYLYTGLMTDTGSFNYSSTKPSTLMAAAKLVEIGVDFSDICDRLNHTLIPGKLELIGKTIDNMEIYFEGKFRYSFVSLKDIQALNLDEEDAEGMTNYLRLPKGTLVAAYIRQKSDGTYKVSLRSGSFVDVSQIANAFGGGGHKRAAGYSIYTDLEEAKNELIDKIGGILKC